MKLRMSTHCSRRSLVSRSPGTCTPARARGPGGPPNGRAQAWTHSIRADHWRVRRHVVCVSAHACTGAKAPCSSGFGCTSFASNRTRTTMVVPTVSRRRTAMVVAINTITTAICIMSHFRGGASYLGTVHRAMKRNLLWRNA